MPDAPCAFPTQKPSRAAAALESRPSSAACPPELQLRPAVPICMTLQMKPLPDPGSQARLCTGLWSLPAALEVPGHRLRRSLPPPRKSSLTVPGHNNHSHWEPADTALGWLTCPCPVSWALISGLLSSLMSLQHPPPGDTHPPRTC